MPLTDKNLYISILKDKSLENNKYKKSIFLDRDGVIIKDKHYIKNPELVELEKGANLFFQNAYELKISIFVITNQSGIERGFFNWDEYKKVTSRMIELLPRPNSLIAIYASGESPHKNNIYRKPQPEMVYLACKNHSINKKNSLFIGDRISDIQTAARAELSCAIHTLTGKGIQERELVNKGIKNGFFFDKLSNKSIKIKLIKNLSDFDFQANYDFS